jgi:uncharacterized Zn-finger protein
MFQTETIKITEKNVKCDGGKGAHGHPAVYLTVDPKTNEVVCPYCSRKFVYDAH